MEHYSGASNPVTVRRAGEQRRDSTAALSLWKERLDRADIARVRDGTAEVASAFYTDDDW